MRSRTLLPLLLAGGLLAGCSAQRPVLYPNAQLDRVGNATAERDIDDCMRRAEQFVSAGGGQAAEVATGTAVGAGAGAAIGAAGGAVTGDAGRGAAVGAASGATAGLLGGLFKTHEPSPVYRNFVERCLRERGYDPIGWQ